MRPPVLPACLCHSPDPESGTRQGLERWTGEILISASSALRDQRWLADRLGGNQGCPALLKPRGGRSPVGQGWPAGSCASDFSFLCRKGPPVPLREGSCAFLLWGSGGGRPLWKEASPPPCCWGALLESRPRPARRSSGGQSHRAIHKSFCKAGSLRHLRAKQAPPARLRRPDPVTASSVATTNN